MRDLFKHYPAWQTRRAMTCAYMPDGSTFNGQQYILPRRYFETLQIGDVLDDEAQNPLIWKRNAT